jgi:RNA polymerase sigma-70 factor, ECF subfamily
MWKDMPIETEERAEIQAAVPGGEVKPAMAARFPHDPALDTLEHLYSLYNSRVYYLCLQMTGNPDDAEDLSQEAFLRMMQKMDTFRGDSAFYTWLRRLAVNVVLLKFQKASWRREVSLEELTEPGSRLEPRSQRGFAALDLELMGTIDRINLERAMDRLAPGLKAVFILHDIEGYEHAEIANLLGCTAGTSKSQLHKARFRLRELLDNSSRDNSTVPDLVGHAADSAASRRRELKFPAAGIPQRLAA